MANSSSAPSARDKWLAWIITAFLSAVAGGGSGFMVDSQEQKSLRQDVAQLRTDKAILELRIQTLESAGSKQSEQLEAIEKKIDEGNDYIRDEVVKALATMQADIAVLKSRR